MRVLVTGADGYVGRYLCAALEKQGDTVIAHDISLSGSLHDVTRSEWIAEACKDKPDMIFHLAANKYALAGEEYPQAVARTNIEGTGNAVMVSQILDIPFILASTCKAADPATAYGASKMIAERITRNANKHVFRFVNILDSTGSVLQIWKNIPKDKPLPVTKCKRMWMTTEAAVRLIIEVSTREPATYVPMTAFPTEVVYMATSIYPDREVEYIDLRRGDRAVERLASEYETIVKADNDLMVIKGPWD